MALQAEGFGGDMGTVGDFLYKLSTMRKQWSKGKIPVSQVEAMGDAGFTIDPNAGMGEWIETLADALSNAKSTDDRNYIAEAFGIGGDRNPMMLFLSQGKQYIADKMKEYGAEAFLWNPEVAERTNRNNKNKTLLENDKQKMYGTPDTLDAADAVTDLERTVVNKVKSPIVQVGARMVEGEARILNEAINVGVGEKTIDEAVESVAKNKKVYAANEGTKWGSGVFGLASALIASGVATGGISSVGGLALLGAATLLGGAGYVFGFKKGEDEFDDVMNGSSTMDVPTGSGSETSGNTVNVYIDPMKAGQVTVTPVGDVITRDRNGMPIIAREAM